MDRGSWRRIWEPKRDDSPEPILVSEVWISEVAVVVCLERGKGDGSADSGDVWEVVARRLRETGDICASTGLPVPVVGLVLVGESDDEWRREIERRAGDQDWNRGDFVLLHAESDKKEEELARVLGGLEQVLKDLPQVEPVDRRELIRRIRVELESRPDLPAEERSLVEAIRKALEGGQDVGHAVWVWTEERLGEEGGSPA